MNTINWHTIIGFEEILYLLEKMVNFFKYKDAENFMKSMDSLLIENVKSENYDMKRNIPNAFIVFATNPIKI